MKPVDQTLFGQKGNCYAAVMASILELPLEAVPGDLGIKGDVIYQAANDLLAPFGLAIVVFRWVAGETWFAPKDAWHVLSGPSPRGDWLHATVGRGGSMIHDPHP